MTNKTIEQMVEEVKAKYNQDGDRVLSTIPSDGRTAIAYNVALPNGYDTICRFGVYNGKVDSSLKLDTSFYGWEYARHLYSLKEEGEASYRLSLSDACGGRHSLRHTLSENPKIDDWKSEYSPFPNLP